MTGFNFFSHGSQDLFPKMIETAKGKSASVASKATIIGNVGAIDKSFSLLQRDFTDKHWAAQLLDTLRNISVVDSRESSRSTPASALMTRILLCLCYTACWIPLWILPSSFPGLAAGAFFIQSGEL